MSSVLDGIMLSDARDVVFQRDPFPELWARIAALSNANLSLTGATLPMSMIAGQDAHTRTHWDPKLSASRVIVVAQEAQGTAVGNDDWNRYWVHMCAGYLGEALVNDRAIYCSGTTIGTAAGMRLYLDGLLSIATVCTELNAEKGV